MIFSCKYDKSGRILEWCRGTSLNGVNSLERNKGDCALAFGVVSKYPKEVLENPSSWVLSHLRVSNVNSNGTVEVERC